VRLLASRVFQWVRKEVHSIAMNKDRIEFLKQRMEADRAALAEALAKQARHKQRDDAKLFAQVGRAVCR
jgi:hypothetical protein